MRELGVMSDNRPENLNVTDALERLKAGNDNYCEGRASDPHRGPERRRELVAGQRPFATILTCADSRVPPELIFDQGLGDLFVIRVAGNVCDDAVLGSIEYASLHLGVNLIAVMGHRACGAVNATVENRDFDGPATHSHIDALIDAIRPAVKAASETNPENLLEASVMENARMVSSQIRTSQPVLAGLVSEGVEVVAAYYDLNSGAVGWLA